MRRALAAALLGLVVVAGCSGPAATPTPTPEPTGS